MALLASPDVGIRGRALLKNGLELIRGYDNFYRRRRFIALRSWGELMAFKLRRSVLTLVSVEGKFIRQRIAILTAIELSYAVHQLLPESLLVQLADAFEQNGTIQIHGRNHGHFLKSRVV